MANNLESESQLGSDMQRSNPHALYLADADVIVCAGRRPGSFRIRVASYTLRNLELAAIA